MLYSTIQQPRYNGYSHLWQMRLSPFNRSVVVGHPITLELIRYSIFKQY